MLGPQPRSCAAPRRAARTVSCVAARPGSQQLQKQQPQQPQPVATTNAADQQDAVAVQLLERSYKQASVPNSALLHQSSSSSSSRSSRRLVRVPLRAALPVLRTVRLTERRLQADLLTVSATVMLLVGYIIWDRGVEELLDNLLGAGPKGSVVCILFGLGLVVAVRMSGRKVSDIFSP